jgi:subtilisin family serine protease
MAVFAAMFVQLPVRAEVAADKPAGRAVAAEAAPIGHIVVLKAGADPAKVARRHGVAPTHLYSHALKGFAGVLAPGQLKKLRADADVAYVEQDLIARKAAQTVPTGVRRVAADVNPLAKIDGVDERVDVDIAILDTGIDLTHPDLNVFFDKNFIVAVKTGDDDEGHGSHVAGTAAAIDNGSGVVGVAPGARLWALKVLSKRGTGKFSDIIEAIDFVTANAAEIEVANMSLSGIGHLASLRTAIQNAVAQGVVFIVAAGNDARDVYGPDGTFDTIDDTIPATYPEVMAVSALADSDGLAGGLGPATSRGLDDTLATFSNYSRSVVVGNPVTSPGAAIDLAAPGVDIYSTSKDGGYETISGTSMSSPHVVGAAALYIAANGRANNAAQVAAIRQALIDAATPQAAWRSGGTNDPDSNPEPLLNVAPSQVTGWEALDPHGPGELALAMVNGYVHSPAQGLTKVRVAFDQPFDPATLATSAFSIVGEAGGDRSSLIQSVVAEPGNLAAVLTLSAALPDADRYTLTVLPVLRGMWNLPYGGSVSLSVACLAGDADGSGVVTPADLLTVRGQAGSAVGIATARYDIDGSGTIRGADLLAVRARLGAALP